jgi:tetratricopeptide (TPR) repeat protein
MQEIRNMKTNLFFVLLLATLLPFAAFSQSVNKRSPKQKQKMLIKGEAFFESKQCLEALPYFYNLHLSEPENAYYTYKLGICYIYHPDEKEKSIDLLTEAAEQNPFLKDVYFYLGKAYRVNGMYEDCFINYEKFLSMSPESENVPEAKRYLTFAKKGLLLKPEEAEAKIENIGPPVNTDYAEYVPLISSDGAMLIFTYRGERSTGGLQDRALEPAPDGIYYEDIFFSYKVGNNWLDPESIDENINTNGHDAAIALSVDGQKLFIYKSTPQDRGDIYISYLKGEEWSVPERLNSNINSRYWEGSCSLSADENTLYFSSERPGGFGDKDIYISRKDASGEWGPAENLGNIINTSFDDDAPFIHPEGNILYFSSKGHNSMGGYDVFVSYYENGAWTKPENLGEPINTKGDDIYFVLTAEGEVGYYSQLKPGKDSDFDIYAVYPGTLTVKPNVALITGIVMTDSKPTDASITVSAEGTGKESVFKANSLTGKYMFALSPGTVYDIKYLAPKTETHEDKVDITSLNTFVRVTKNLNYITDQESGNIKLEKEEQNIQEKIKEQLEIKKRKNPDAVYTVTGKDTQDSEQVKDEIAETLERNQATRDKAEQETEKEETAEDSYSTIKSKDEAEMKEEQKIAIINNQDEDEYELNIISPVISEKNETVANAVARDEKQQEKKQDERKSTIIVDEDDEKEEAVVDIFTKDAKLEKNIAKEPSKEVIAKKESTTKVVKTEDLFTKNYCEPSIDFNAAALYAGKDLNDTLVYRDFIATCGSYSCENLIYKVQIGAYRFPKNFMYPHLDEFGPAEIIKYPDGITRFNMKEFDTLKEAENFRQAVITKGTKDAWITAFFNGERKLLMEVIEKNFFRQPGL